MNVSAFISNFNCRIKGSPLLYFKKFRWGFLFKKILEKEIQNGELY